MNKNENPIVVLSTVFSIYRQLLRFFLVYMHGFEYFPTKTSKNKIISNTLYKDQINAKEKWKIKNSRFDL